MAKQFAVFDIDGTLIRWQLYHAVADELARRGHLGATEYEAVKQARMTWKKREQEDSFEQYERALVNLVDQAITSLTPDDLLSASQAVISEYKDQVYTYTRDLIQHLKAQGYVLFAISASQRDIVGMLSQYYGFDDFAGSVYAVQGNYFTGKKAVLMSERKPQVLQALAQRHGASFEGSIGIGDSESDIAMLESVEHAIAFNPTRQLYDHARQRGWRIVVERKNVVYQLEPGDGNYQLQ